MAKFAGSPTRLSAPIQTADTVPTTVTHEGADAYVRDPKSELFLLAVTNMVSEQTFYETGSDRDMRFIQLLHTVTKADPDWMQEFIPWLRQGALMRSASVQAAAEYARAGGVNARQVIARTLWRADEPGELMAYWFSRYGRSLPASVKRGIADAAQRLFTENAALKYDGKGNAWRLADVIQLAHVKPKDQEQSHLFKYLLDRRFGADVTVDSDVIPLVDQRMKLEAIDQDNRRTALAEGIPAGATWEWLSGWLPGGMDAEAWEAIIPRMGYMALLRNLRNFDEAGISVEAKRYVATKLVDTDEVKNSRQFPYRFWSAYSNIRSLTWGGVLEAALELSTGNIPAIGGRTLVLTDTSGSMQSSVSGRSVVKHFEIAALFAASVARACEDVTLVSWADGFTDLKFRKGDSVLRTIELVGRHLGRDGHGTFLDQAVAGTYDGHDRVVIFSDMQVMGNTIWGRNNDPRKLVPADIPIFVFNTGGYAATPTKVGADNTYELGGFTDAVFRMIPLVENRGDWPWENKGESK